MASRAGLAALCLFVACARGSSPDSGARATPTFTDGGAAGACAGSPGRTVPIVLERDVPNPRCAFVRGSQRLRVVNHFDRPVTATLGGMRLVVLPGHGVTVKKTFEEYLEPGGYVMTTDLYDGKTYSAEIRYRR